MKQESWPFWRLGRVYALGVLAFGVVVGMVQAVQVGLGLRGGDAAIMRVVSLSSVTTLAPGITGSALLVALVVWAHPLRVPELQAQLSPCLKRGLLLPLPGYVAAVVLTIAAGFAVATAGFGVPWSVGVDALLRVAGRDWLFGALASLVDAALILGLAWRYLARLQAGRSSLPMKLVLAWTFGSGLRMTVGLLFSMLMPS